MIKPLVILLILFVGLVIEAAAQDVYIANPFVQPNDSTLNWYGSGDANGDDTLTWDDVTRMQELIDGTFSDPDDRRLYDRSDVNGDQAIDAIDRGMLEEHLNTAPFFQPRWYWAKQDRTGQEEIILKAMRIDSSENICIDYPIEDCDCDQYRQQTYITFRGISQEYIDFLDGIGDSYYEYENNGRFNLPIFHFVTQDINEDNVVVGGHAMNLFVFGTNLFEWDGLCIIEPQEIYQTFEDNINIQPGEGYFIGVNADVFFSGPPKNPYSGSPVTVYARYGIMNLIPSLLDTYNSNYMNLITQKDTQNPQISTSLEEGETYNTGSNQTITITDQYPKRQWYSVDEGQTQIALSSGINTITLPSGEGDFSYLIYAGDDFYNEVLDTINITMIDATGIDTDDPTQLYELTIFPNPASDIITIQSLPQSTTQIDLLDVTGRIVHSVAVMGSDDGIEMDLSRIETGIYLIVTKDEKGQVTGIDRVIKQ